MRKDRSKPVHHGIARSSSQHAQQHKGDDCRYGMTGKCAAMMRAGAAAVFAGGGLLDRSPVLIDRDLFGNATRTNCDLHQPADLGRRKVVNDGGHRHEEHGKSRNSSHRLKADRMKGIAAKICRTVHREIHPMLPRRVKAAFCRAGQQSREMRRK